MTNKNSQLEIIVKESGLELAESESLLKKFGNYEQIANEWEVKAKTIVVTSAEQVTEMKMAKDARKYFSDLRIELEKSRKAMKEQSLRKGQAIDAVARFLVSLISPIEEYLKSQEDFVKIQEAKKAEELRLIEEKRIEDERIAKEKAEAEERERIRIENEKLRKELEEKEKASRLEREESQRKLNIEIEKANKERLETQKKIDDEKARVDKEKLESDRKQKELEEKLAHMIECPNCHHKFNI